MAAEYRQKEYACAHHQNDGGQLFRKIVQAFLQRRAALLCLIHQGGYFAKLGVHAGDGDKYSSTSIGDERAGENHVFLIAQGNVFPCESIGRLFYAFAFSRQ